jgi:hypothetical protein
MAVFSMALFLAAVTVMAFAEEEGKKPEISGYFKSEVWVGNNNDKERQYLSSFKNTIDWAMEYKLKKDWALFFHPRFFYDAAYAIRDSVAFDRAEKYMAMPQRTTWLRDAYLDYTSDQLDMRIGKQQVVWGQADGFPVLDRVHPYDLTQHWLPDFADIRIPLWMLKLEYSPLLNSTAQFLFIPDNEQSYVAPAGTPFAYRSVNDFYNNFVKIQEALGNKVDVRTTVPPRQFENSKIGLRWQSIFNGVEYTLNWLYGYSSSAYTYSGPVKSLGGGKLLFNFERESKLMHIIGGTFNRSFVEPGPLQGVTLRGEFGFLHGEPTYYGTPGSRKLTENTDKYAYVLGLDKNIFTKWIFSTQFIQYIHNNRAKSLAGVSYGILDSYTYGPMDKVENIVTMKIATQFMHDRLKPEMLVIYQDDGDGRFAFKARYEAKDNLFLTLGLHHFWGNPWGSNGQFRNNDQYVCEVKYTF